MFYVCLEIMMKLNWNVLESYTLSIYLLFLFGILIYLLWIMNKWINVRMIDSQIRFHSKRVKCKQENWKFNQSCLWIRPYDYMWGCVMWFVIGSRSSSPKPHHMDKKKTDLFWPRLVMHCDVFDLDRGWTKNNIAPERSQYKRKLLKKTQKRNALHLFDDAGSEKNESNFERSRQIIK